MIDEADHELQKRYCQFYAYLAREADRQLSKVLDAIDRRNDSEDTVIVRLADHGDMAMAHGKAKRFVRYSRLALR